MKASHNRTERSSVSLRKARPAWRRIIAPQSHTMTGGMLKIGSEGRATRTSGERKSEISRRSRAAQASREKEKARGGALPAGLGHALTLEFPATLAVRIAPSSERLA